VKFSVVGPKMHFERPCDECGHVLGVGVSERLLGLIGQGQGQEPLNTLAPKVGVTECFEAATNRKVKDEESPSIISFTYMS